LEQSFTTRVPNDIQAVPDHRERFVEWLALNGVGGDELNALRLIFDELVNNSVEHGCQNPGDEVAVETRVNESMVEVSVRDPGDGELTADIFPCGPNGQFEESGRGAGLILVRAFTDEIYVERIPAGGTRIRAVKYRAGATS
jgi:anti-sigma regulatory factor (Ser/Thr protein kinase)